MKVSDFIVEFLVQKKSNVIFGYIGGMITHLVDSIHQHPNAEYIQVYHEQTAAIAAEGYARVSGNTGVAIATSGPGATNMITGIANAYFDSIPVIYITGQVNTSEFKYDKPIRQQGFQETDVVSIVRPITKYAKLVDKAEDIAYELEKAFFIANDGRKGPVLLDIPMNVQRENIDIKENHNFFDNVGKEESNINWETIGKLIQDSEKPLVLLGGGVNSQKGIEIVKVFLQKFKFPVVVSLMGKGAFDENDGRFVGMIGSYGNRCANIAIANCDLLLALGTRLDTRQTGAKIEGFLKEGTIVHVDIDNNELEHHRLNNRFRIKSDAVEFLSELNSRINSVTLNNKWLNWISFLKNNYNQSSEIERFVENKAPYRLFEFLNRIAPQDCIYVADIGQNQMWAAQTLIIDKNQQFLTSGGHAPMGYALPAAVGAAFANPSKRIIAICGDGGFHMATQALMLISQYNLNISVFVLNNQSLGMITQFQELYFEKRMAGTVQSGGYLVPNIDSLSKSYGIPYLKLTENELADESITNKLFCTANIIVEFHISGQTKVYPKLEYNKPIDEPSPYLTPEELTDIKGKLSS